MGRTAKACERWAADIFNSLSVAAIHLLQLLLLLFNCNIVSAGLGRKSSKGKEKKDQEKPKNKAPSWAADIFNSLSVVSTGLNLI